MGSLGSTLSDLNPLSDIEIGGIKPLDPFSGFGLIEYEEPGEEAAQAARDAAAIQAQYQREALDYLKQREELPQYYREQALTGLGGLYGLGGADALSAQQQIVSDITQSPLYGALTDTSEAERAGTESLMRQAAATGGLRSGNVQANMYDYITNLRNQSKNQALQQLYNQRMSGLAGLASLPSNVGQIAQSMSGIGTTLAQGQLGAAQALQAGQQQNINTLLGLGQLGVGIGGLLL